MNQRSSELEIVISETQRVKELEREVDRWINKTEAELDVIDHTRETKADSAVRSPRRFVQGLDANRRKRLQDLSECLSGPAKEAWAQYRRDAEALMKQFKQEDTSKLQSDVDTVEKRWKDLHERLALMNQWLASHADGHADTLGPDTDRIVLTKHRRTPSLEHASRAGLTERLEQVERRLNQLGMLDAELQRQVSVMNENMALNERRGQIVTELQMLQNELNTLSTQMGGGTRPSNNDLTSLADSELHQRYRQLRDRVTSFRQSVQTATPTHFLSRLKQLNSWVSHRDAAFRAIICPLHGDLLFIMKMRELML
ncbi:unnamed protein product, partial [Echinostoma caproni]|uniref:Nesprin-1 n=1 Tax=Echinostoma caproni TaxID=27848 RepID=A0A183AQ51_9TREM